MFQIFDYYSASGMVLLWFCFFECITIAYVYGVEKFYEDIQDMIGYRLNPWLKICWLIFTPIITMVCFILISFSGIFFQILVIILYFQGILLFSIVTYKPLTYNRTYVYPTWAQVIGWSMALVPMSMIPIYFTYYLVTSPGGSLLQVGTYILFV